MVISFILLIIASILQNFHAANDDLTSFTNPVDIFTKKGQCKGLWRPDRLIGRCFGLELHSTYDELKHIKSVNSSSVCRTMCCNLGSKCVSWQYEKVAKTCKLGAPVRLGMEHAATDFWCEPFAPSVWNGRKLANRNADGSCTWGEALPSQCFQLGPERLSPDKKALDTNSCQESCCKDANCEMWQEIPGRGCYYGNSKGVSCEKVGVQMVFDGGRKCIKNFCGGMEDKILGKLQRRNKTTV